MDLLSKFAIATVIVAWVAVAFSIVMVAIEYKRRPHIGPMLNDFADRLAPKPSPDLERFVSTAGYGPDTLARAAELLDQDATADAAFNGHMTDAVAHDHENAVAGRIGPGGDNAA
jgi:hypothetical protein